MPLIYYCLIFIVVVILILIGFNIYMLRQMSEIRMEQQRIISILKRKRKRPQDAQNNE